MAEKSGSNKLRKVPLGKVENWLVDEARKVGLDIEGFEHEITNEFVSHVMNRHGNAKSEAAHGQVAIKQDDFNKIPELVREPDFMAVGAKRNGKDILVYARKMPDGTTLCIEEILRGKNNRKLRGKTMYKRKGNINETNLEITIKQNGKTDLSNVKIVGRGGGHSPSEAV